MLLSGGCLSLVLALACQASGDAGKPAPATADGGAASSELKEKAARLGAAKSYAFEVKIQREGGFGGNDATPTIGKYAEGKPVEFKRGELVAYRLDEKLAYQKNGKQKNGSWELRVDEGFGGRSPEGKGDSGKSGEPTSRPDNGGNRRGGDMREGFALMQLSNLKLPHELVAGIETKLKDLTARDEGGKRIFEGGLVKEFAEELSGVARMRDPAAARGGKGDAKASGTARIVTSRDGRIETVLIETKSSSGFGDVWTTTTYTMKDVGSTTVAPPKEALARLGAAADGSH